MENTQQFASPQNSEQSADCLEDARAGLLSIWTVSGVDFLDSETHLAPGSTNHFKLEHPKSLDSGDRSFQKCSTGCGHSYCSFDTPQATH
ncbi:hypothetical protein STEG23_020060 [Scotinomys teguina]